MKVLCPLSDWKERKVERGKSVGNTIIQRDVLALDPWNYIIGVQNKNDMNVIGQMYYGNLATLFIDLELVLFGQEFKYFIKQLIDILSNRLNKKFNLDIKNPHDNAEKIGKEIDRKYDISFLKEYPPTVYYRIFEKELENDHTTTPE